MGTAAAVIIAKERHLVNEFVRVGATSMATARAPSEMGIDEQGLAMRRLRERAVVREAASGRFYADIEVWNALRRTRRRLVAVLLAIVALATVLIELRVIRR